MASADAAACELGLSLRGMLRFYWFTSVFGAGKAIPKMDISRCMEYPLVYTALRLFDGARILDIGAGYSVFPLYLAKSRRYEVYITDPEIHLRGVLGFHIKKLRRLGLSYDLQAGRIRVESQDARRLAYHTGSFDRVTCISVLEHIPGDGDSVSMKEIARVLRPGGLAVITVPWAEVYSERTSSPWVEYFERSYSDGAIQNRLVEPSGMVEIMRRYFGVHPMVARYYWRNSPGTIRMLFQATSPLWAQLFARVGSKSFSYASGLLLVLKKRGEVEPGEPAV
jgi:ubiquinone/menaquinone biosynthesis C-methylase UbiE